MEGTPFGQYVLLSLVGRGGMGEVWRAHDTATDRIVALKVLPAHLADDDMFQKRFRREARVAASLSEPHVVPIHGFGEIDGRLYVDMRLIEGRDLESMLADGPLEPARAVMIVEQVASALNAAHEVGLIHRDVKPSNILVAKSDFAYLIDFGIARMAGETGLTGTGSTIGTWAYMAPERFGAGDPDLRSDVYALACVLHQALTAQRPFPGESVERQVAAHLSMPPPRPSVINRGVPQAIDDVIARGMAKNPDQRYSTTVELTDAAHGAITTPNWQPEPPAAPPPIHPAPPTRPDAYNPPPFRREVPVAGPPLAPAQRWPPESIAPQGFRPPPTPAAQRRSSRRPAILIPAIVGVILLVAGAIFAVIQLTGESTDTPATAAAPESSAPAVPSTPPPVPGPTFEGSFTAAFGPPVDAVGDPLDGAPRSETWVTRSACSASGCVATAAAVGAVEHSSALVFDSVDGHWLAVSELTANGCDNVPSQRWEVVSLDPQPDGTLSGQQRTYWPSVDCPSRGGVVTFTRTGDVPGNAAVADPTAQSTRQPSPGQALYGKYHYEENYSDGHADKYDNMAAQTNCLRTGRCLTRFGNDDISIYLIFADGSWLHNEVIDGSCKNGGPRRVNYTTTYPLPQPPQDPIALLTGQGHQVVTGGCPKNIDYTATLTRTGD